VETLQRRKTKGEDVGGVALDPKALKALQKYRTASIPSLRLPTKTFAKFAVHSLLTPPRTILTHRAHHDHSPAVAQTFDLAVLDRFSSARILNNSMCPAPPPLPSSLLVYISARSLNRSVTIRSG
jgi:hypothetical protein